MYSGAFSASALDELLSVLGAGAGGVSLEGGGPSTIGVFLDSGCAVVGELGSVPFSLEVAPGDVAPSSFCR